MAEKEEYLAGKSGSGYTKLLTQALGEGRRDHKETFSYGKFCATSTQPMPPPFKYDAKATTTIKRFYQACHDTSERLMELFAIALELPKEHFRQSHSFGQFTAMSLIHYPALSADQRVGLGALDIRAGEHKDWGTLTMLFQQPDGEPGLEVYLPSTALSPSVSGSSAAAPTVEPSWAWHAAPVPPPGGFLVNVGLGMELWSGSNYKATMHRVIFPTRPARQPGSEAPDVEGLRDRYTLAYFVQPDDNVPFHPVRAGGQIDYAEEAITSGELFDLKLRESMERSKALLAAAPTDGDRMVAMPTASYTGPCNAMSTTSTSSPPPAYEPSPERAAAPLPVFESPVGSSSELVRPHDALDDATAPPAPAAPPTNLVPLTAVRAKSAIVRCPACKTVGPTRVDHIVTGYTHAVACGLTLLTLCWVPYVLNGFKDHDHHCRTCRAVMVTYSGKSSKATVHYPNA
ncbi:hypothetical protein Q5752_000268 [Cryptotrichosporon argae]